MNWIARIRHEHDVARRSDGLRDVGKAFFRTECRNDLRVRIQFHAEAALVIGRLGATKPIDAARGRIAVRAWLSKRLLQLLDDVRGRRQIGIAHAHVDDVLTGITRGSLGTVHLLEHVRRQASYAVELFHGRAPMTGKSA